MAVLALDPSLACTGWVFIDQVSNIQGGAVITKKESTKRRIYVGDDDVRRLTDVLETLDKLKPVPSVIWAEQPTGSRSARAAKASGLIMGLVASFSFCRKIPLHWVQPDDVKFALAGNRTASKSLMVKKASEVIGGLLDRQTTVKAKEAIADAYGVYVCAFRKEFCG